LSALAPEQKERIESYLKPWQDELQNRKAGLERFEGKWLSPQEIAKTKAEREALARQSFLDKELNFSISEEAVSQKAVFVTVALLGLSFLFLLVTFAGGVKGLFSSPGLASWVAVILGGLGIGAYAFGGWLLFQTPPGYSGQGVTLQKVADGADSKNVALDDLIFVIQQPRASNSPAPDSVVLEDLALNSFLKSYVKIAPSLDKGSYSILRKGMKVEVKGDRVLVFDEMNWAGKELVVCYTLFFSMNGEELRFGKTEASAGNLPLPGRIFTHLWGQVGPLMGDVVAKSRVLDNYYIKRMESGVVEISSIRTAARQASRATSGKTGGG